MTTYKLKYRLESSHNGQSLYSKVRREELSYSKTTSLEAAFRHSTSTLRAKYRDTDSTVIFLSFKVKNS